MDYLKKIIEILIAPLVLTIFTWYFTNTMQDSQKNTDNIKLAFEVLKSIDDKDLNRTLLCQKIINEVLDGKQYQSLDTIINNYIQSELYNVVKSGDMDSIISMRNKIQNGGTESSRYILKKYTSAISDSINRYEKSKSLEKEAFKHIISNEKDSAIKKFSEIEKIYPGFHNATEIRQELQKTNNIKFVKQKIVKDLSWKAPKEEMNIIKKDLN
jgi:hypothetical protein